MNIKHCLMLLALTALMATDARAQSHTYYDARTGRVIGRSTTGTGNATTYYGADGRVTGRSTISGNTETFYGADGRTVGKTTRDKK